MRVRLIADGATAEQMRGLLAALSSRTSVGDGATVELDGPELWKVSTPPLIESEAQAVVKVWP